MDEAHLEKIENQFRNSIRLSKITFDTDLSSKKVLLIDGFGMLSSLYRFGNFAYVGGGFNKAGIHNILEAAVYGIPVIWGPNHQRAFEAQELMETGGGISIQDSRSLQEWLVKLQSNKEFYSDMCSASREYVLNKKGATEKIYLQTVNTSTD
jgi:3-deoxy-D-manno-octulosonic-acid transferase